MKRQNRDFQVWDDYRPEPLRSAVFGVKRRASHYLMGTGILLTAMELWVERPELTSICRYTVLMDTYR